MPDNAPPDDLEAARLARRRHTRQLTMAMVGAFVALIVMNVVQDRYGGQLLVGRLVTHVATNAAGMGLVLAAILWLRRAGVNWLQPPPRLTLDKAGRRAASRALLPGGTVTPEHRAGILEVARFLGGSRWAPWFFLAVVAGGALGFAVEDGPGRWLFAGSMVIGLAFAGWYVFALRKASAIVKAESTAGPESA